MKLIDCVKTVFIVYYNEDVSALAHAIKAEGFTDVRPVRADYSEEQLNYCRQAKCLLGHHNAWQYCKQVDGLSIVLEADFVPCKGFANLPLPFAESLIGQAWGWLYACGGRVYEYDGDFIRGHSSTTVAYVIDNIAAQKVEGFVAHEFANNNPVSYSPWDTYMRVYAQQQGVPMYLVPKSYGEHGGLPNPEHKINNITQGHQADRLSSDLHFLPTYAGGSVVKFRFIRFKAYAKAWLRLIGGRYIEKETLFNQSYSPAYRWRMCVMALKRLF